jgi:MFS family permease
VSIGSISVMPNLATAIAVGTVGGLGSGIAFAPWFSLLQRATADGERGTAFAIAETLEQSSFIAGMVLAGAVVGLLGPQATYLLPGALLLGATIVAIRLDRRWDSSCPKTRSADALVPG